MIALFRTIWAIEIFHLRILFAFKTSLYSYYQGRVCKNVIIWMQLQKHQSFL